MAMVSAVVGTTVMLLAGLPWHRSFLIALITSLFGAYTELISRNGNDTVTVPVVNVAVMLALHFAFGGYNKQREQVWNFQICSLCVSSYIFSRRICSYSSTNFSRITPLSW